MCAFSTEIYKCKLNNMYKCILNKYVTHSVTIQVYGPQDY